ADVVEDPDGAIGGADADRPGLARTEHKGAGPDDRVRGSALRAATACGSAATTKKRPCEQGQQEQETMLRHGRSPMGSDCLAATSTEGLQAEITYSRTGVNALVRSSCIGLRPRGAAR